MNQFSLSEIWELSTAERIQLAEDIWDSVAADPNSLYLTPIEKKELDKRLQTYRRNPQKGSSWDEVKKRIRKQA